MKISRFYFVLISLIPLATLADDNLDLTKLKTQADNIALQYVSTLKPQLKKAIRSGGFPNAVEICSSKAPEIATELSERTGWSIKRVSLKPRNKTNATPDVYEEKILKQFDHLEPENNRLENLVHYEVVDNQFRYLKAQQTEGLCLSCHGSAVSDEITEKIKKLYPHDIATGYSLGEIRGAISLSLDLPNFVSN